MKHRIIVAACLAVALVLAALSAQAYHQRKTTADAKEAAAAKATQQRFVADSVRLSNLQKRVDKLDAACQNFQKVFTQLPVATKLKTPVPDCS